jgi:hypothetical protein
MTSWLPSTSSRHAKVSRTTTPSRDSPYCWKAPHTPGGQGSRVLSSHGQKPQRQFETSSHQFPPAYQVYQQVFATRQNPQTSTGLFVSEKRALLVQVNPPDTESRQIDLIYGLLRLEIRDRVPRKTIRDFRSLLDAAREVEAVMRERSSKPPQSHQRRYVTNVPIAEIWAMT